MQSANENGGENGWRHHLEVKFQKKMEWNGRELSVWRKISQQGFDMRMKWSSLCIGEVNSFYKRVCGSTCECNGCETRRCSVNQWNKSDCASFWKIGEVKLGQGVWKWNEVTKILCICGGSSDIIQGRATCEGNEGERSLVHQASVKWKIVKFNKRYFLCFCIGSSDYPRVCNMRRKRRETKFSASVKWKIVQFTNICAFALVHVTLSKGVQRAKETKFSASVKC